jgi:hypothetical protein
MQDNDNPYEQISASIQTRQYQASPGRNNRSGARLTAALTSTMAALVTVTSASAVAAESAMDDSLFRSQHVLYAGIAQQSLEARIGANAQNFDPVEITLNDLGVDDRDYSYYLEYRYRFKPRWALAAGAYSFGGSGGRTSSRTFNYDGVEFTAGSQINASLGIDAYIVDLMYRVYDNDRVEVMLGGGVHALDLDVSIGGQVQVNDTSGEFRQSGSTLLAPVPNLRGTVDWAISDRIEVTFIGGWLSANVDDYEGAFLYGHLRGVYRIGENLGVALGYQVTDVDITENRARGDLSYDLMLDGPTLTIGYSF